MALGNILIISNLPQTRPGPIVRRIGPARAFTQSEAEVVGKPSPCYQICPRGTQQAASSTVPRDEKPE